MPAEDARAAARARVWWLAERRGLVIEGFPLARGERQRSKDHRLCRSGPGQEHRNYNLLTPGRSERSRCPSLLTQPPAGPTRRSAQMAPLDGSTRASTPAPDALVPQARSDRGRDRRRRSADRSCGRRRGLLSSATPSATPATATTTTTLTASAIPPPGITMTQTVRATVKTTRTIRVTSKPRTVTVTKNPPPRRASPVVVARVAEAPSTTPTAPRHAPLATPRYTSAIRVTAPVWTATATASPVSNLRAGASKASRPG
jgi:hypothetical protein